MARSSAPGLLISFLILVAGLLLAFSSGRYAVSLGDLFAVIAAKLTGQPANVAPAIETVIWQVRGPRVVAAMLIGAALAVAGTAFRPVPQSLVSPDILGRPPARRSARCWHFFSLGIFAIQALACRRARGRRSRLHDRLRRRARDPCWCWCSRAS